MVTVKGSVARSRRPPARRPLDVPGARVGPPEATGEAQRDEDENCHENLHGTSVPILNVRSNMNFPDKISPCRIIGAASRSSTCGRFGPWLKPALAGRHARSPPQDGPFEVRKLMTDPYVVVIAADSPLVRRGLKASDLNGLPMVGSQHGKHQDLAEDFLGGRGVRPRVVFRSNDNGTVQAMVASGLGFALAPLLAVDEKDPKVRLIELAEPVPPRVLVVVWHRDRYRPPAAAAFVETAIAVAASVERAHTAFLGRRISAARPRGR